MAEELTVIDPLLPLLNARPLGLFSDIDGTLAPIVPNPEEARVSPLCRTLLEELIALGVHVALITGRTIERARSMVGLDGAVYAANHGVSVWIDGHDETPERAREYISLARTVFEEIGSVPLPGVFVEAAGPNLAIHYRRAADEEIARQAILSAIGSSASAGGFQVREGRKVFELRAPLDIDKGTALSDLALRLGVRALLCLGDDRTDVDMFEATRRQRGSGLQAVSIAVTSDEATAELLASADYFVGGVPGVEWLLGEILSALRDQES
jgi:trehalose 6-phosphate phosphatase